LAWEISAATEGSYGTNKQVIRVQPGQVLPHRLQVMGNIFRTLEDLVIYLLKNIFDVPLVIPEDPGRVYQSGSKRDAMPVHRV
jgi:hypothetical protein